MSRQHHLRMIHVAVGLILNNRGEILVAERAQHKHQGGLWEFPGGKVEVGETVFAALQRELEEELNIHITQATEWLQFPYEYSDKKILLDTWIVKEFAGVAEGREGQQIKWILLENLTHMKIPDANRLIVKKLLNELCID